MSSELGLHLRQPADRGPDPVRHGRAGPLGAGAGRPRALPEPERVAQLGDERIELDLGAIGARPVVRLPRRVDVLLQVDDAFLVRAAGGLVERRAGRVADVVGRPSAGACGPRRRAGGASTARSPIPLTSRTVADRPLNTTRHVSPSATSSAGCRWIARRRVGLDDEGPRPSRRAPHGPGPRPRRDAAAGRRAARDRSTASSSGNSSGSTVIAVDGGAAANRVAATCGLTDAQGDGRGRAQHDRQLADGALARRLVDGLAPARRGARPAARPECGDRCPQPQRRRIPPGLAHPHHRLLGGADRDVGAGELAGVGEHARPHEVGERRHHEVVGGLTLLQDVVELLQRTAPSRPPGRAGRPPSPARRGAGAVYPTAAAADAACSK